MMIFIHSSPFGYGLRMEVGETTTAKDRAAWRRWLRKNHAKKKEIWLIYYKKNSGKPSVAYDQSVEEALCYGWIDGLLKSIDEEKYTRRFTPRRKNSIWAQSNVARVHRMIKEKKMTDAGLAIIPQAVLDGKATEGPPVVPKHIPELEDLTAALAKNKKARENWAKFPPSHRKIHLHWINDAKRPETRERRIKKTVEMAESGEKRPM